MDTKLPRAPTLDDAPPLAPLSPAQQRFLQLHVRYLVTKWRWLMQGMHLRAWTECGRVATISLAELRTLVDDEYLTTFEPAGVRLTSKGRDFQCEL